MPGRGGNRLVAVEAKIAASKGIGDQGAPTRNDVTIVGDVT